MIDYQLSINQILLELNLNVVYLNDSPNKKQMVRKYIALSADDCIRMTNSEEV